MADKNLNSITFPGLPDKYKVAQVADEYSSSSTYAVGDIVNYLGTTYRCTTAITTEENWTAGHWIPVKIADEVTNLKSALPDTYVALNGENQVAPQNIEGMEFTKTTTEVEGENIFESSMLFEEGYYVNVSDGKVTHGGGDFNTYVVPVNNNSKYNFTEARFALLAKGNTLGSDAVGSLLPYATTVQTGEASYLFLSYAPNTSITVKEVTTQTTYSDFEIPDWMKGDSAELDSRLDAVESGKVDKDGTWQIKPQNIDGVVVTGGNIFDDAERLYCSYSQHTGEDGYVNIDSDDNKAVITPNSSLASFLIEVKPNTHYTANNPIRFAVLLKNLTTEGTSPVKYSTVVGTALANISSFDTGEADHIIVSFNYNSYPINSFIISEGMSPVEEPEITLPSWLSGSSESNKNKYASSSGNLASGGNLQIQSARTNLRKGERITFDGKITSFSSLKIGLSFSTSVSTDSNQINTFLIDTTNISYYKTSSATPVTVVHGLTITNNIQIIWEMTDIATCKLTVISNGVLFSHVFENFVRHTVGCPYVLSVGSVLSECKLIWTCIDIDKKIWMFGDSYFAYDAARWPYYLHSYGYDKNVLLDGFPGEGGTNGRVSFNNLLTFGKPKFAVWCLGMNDGGDSVSAPSADWVRARDLFISYCQNANVIPIFGTIPTVPTINHEQKNAWIRNSEYRYIDFAKAVGANSSGVWYSGMLSNDGVHPTEYGAKALFAQVLIDLPEIMIDDFSV